MYVKFIVIFCCIIIIFTEMTFMALRCDDYCLDIIHNDVPISKNKYDDSISINVNLYVNGNKETNPNDDNNGLCTLNTMNKGSSSMRQLEDEMNTNEQTTNNNPNLEKNTIKAPFCFFIKILKKRKLER